MGVRLKKSARTIALAAPASHTFALPSTLQHALFVAT
jgi:hypothetical protein